MNRSPVPLFTDIDAEFLMGEECPSEPAQRDAWCDVLRQRLIELWGAEEYFERSLLAGLLPEALFDFERRLAGGARPTPAAPRRVVAGPS